MEIYEKPARNSKLCKKCENMEFSLEKLEYDLIELYLMVTRGDKNVK